jgi:uncharacterized tellurite resistance protein B-like protein
MDLIGFTDEQKKTLLDLLIIGMYADGSLADAEDAKIDAVLDTITFPSESDRDRFIDASFARARQHLESPQSTRNFVADIARQFPTPEIRRKACAELEDLIASDNKIADKESELLAIVREEFKL